MIKFFRNIRQTLLNEGKTTKYFKYAIGEIFLVVIGILIALQINTWNQERIKIQNEKDILISFEKESRENLELLKISQRVNDSFTNAARELIIKLKQGTREFSTEEMSESFNYTTGIIDAPVLDGIIASNSDVMVTRKNLVEDLRDLQYAYSRIKKSEYYLDEFWNSSITEFFVNCGFYFEGFSLSDPPLTLGDIETGGYSKKQFIALLNMKISLQDYRELRRKQAEKKTVYVLDQLTK